MMQFSDVEHDKKKISWKDILQLYHLVEQLRLIRVDVGEAVKLAAKLNSIHPSANGPFMAAEKTGPRAGTASS